MISKKELVEVLRKKCYSPEDIEDWLTRSNPFYGGKTPLQLIKKKSTKSIESFIKNLKEGSNKGSEK